MKLSNYNDSDETKAIGSLLLIILIMALAVILFSYPLAYLLKHSF